MHTFTFRRRHFHPLSLPVILIDTSTAGAEDYPLEEDVSSIDGLMNAFYAVVSGPVGFRYQAARDLSLYAPNAIITRVKDDGTLERHGIAIEQAMITEPWKEGFYEVETHRIIEEFGNLAHVWSTFEMRYSPDGPAFDRGISSVSLYHDKDRWWVASWSTQNETDDPLPAVYLPDNE